MNHVTRRFRDSKNPHFIGAVKEIQALAKATSPEECRRAFASATAAVYEEEFRRRYGVTRSKSTACIQRLLGKRCGISLQRDCDCHPPGTDHASLWLKDGKPHLFVSQPYNIRGSILGDATQFASEHGLELEIRADHNFHFPSSVLLMIWRIPEKRFQSH